MSSENGRQRQEQVPACSVEGEVPYCAKDGRNDETELDGVRVGKAL